MLLAIVGWIAGIIHARSEKDKIIRELNPQESEKYRRLEQERKVEQERIKQKCVDLAAQLKVEQERIKKEYADLADQRKVEQELKAIEERKKAIEEGKKAIEEGKIKEAERKKKEEQLHSKLTSLYENEFIKRNLLSDGEKITFHQSATYKGGILGYPQQSGLSGIAFILSNSFVFYDKAISWKFPYENVIEVKLDSPQLVSDYGFLALAAGEFTSIIKEKNNTLEIIYFDNERTERSVKFDIEGALTIQGNAARATEFLNHLLEFKGSFASKSSSNDSNSIYKLEKLNKLKNDGVINQSEFEAKKRELLEKL